MAVSAYSPSTLPIVGDLYSVSFSDCHTVGGLLKWAALFTEKGCLKDGPAKGGEH